MDAVASARRAGAPSRVIDDLAQRRVLGYFFESVEEYFDATEYEWDEYLVPAHRLEGRDIWHWALIESPPVNDFNNRRQNCTPGAPRRGGRCRLRRSKAGVQPAARAARWSACGREQLR
ncbi:MAG: hypothetical protein U5R48_02665 [Gammaproteobacteria bacterium]|nr:hypothetical protein [Gammaproteobacteria bacterium]